MGALPFGRGWALQVWAQFTAKILFPRLGLKKTLLLFPKPKTSPSLKETDALAEAQRRDAGVRRATCCQAQGRWRMPGSAGGGAEAQQVALAAGVGTSA